MNHTAFILAFNAEKTLEACLRHITPFFDKVVVVEGAVGPNDPWTHNTDQFTQDGRSTDKTLEIISRYPVELIQRIGFWEDKTAMCNAATCVAAPGWLWQFDADEFFHATDILTLKEKLEGSWANAAAVEFRAFHFWGTRDFVTDPRKDCWGNIEPWRRIFRFEPGDRFLTHEPPRMRREGEIITRDMTTDLDLFVYHYGYIFEGQAKTKSILYNDPTVLETWHDFRAGRRATAHQDAPVIEFMGTHPVDL
jgi:hypothetical protein